MSKIADDHYIRLQQREQMKEFFDYMMKCAANFMRQKYGIDLEPDPIVVPQRKRNSPRKWTEHPVHGEKFKQMNESMTRLRHEIRELEWRVARYQTEGTTPDLLAAAEATLASKKDLLSLAHTEYDGLRRQITAEEASH